MKKAISVTLDTDLIQKLDEVRHAGMSRSQFINALLRADIFQEDVKG